MNRRTHFAAVTLASLSLASLAACAHEPPAAPENGPPQTFAEQVTWGAKLYASECASCHGDSGEGSRAPRVVGIKEGALPLDPPPSAKVRKAPFHTAADVAGFVVANMPAGNAGKLTEDQYWAILAFDLKANGVELATKLDRASAPNVVLHP